MFATSDRDYTLQMSAMWLASLPPEVTTRIAEFTSHGEQNEDLLRFAQSHESLREPAFAALSNQLTIEDANEDPRAVGHDLRQASEWARICPPTTSKLEFKSLRPLPAAIHTLAAPLLGTNIKCVDVTACYGEWIYEYVASCTSLKKLAISVYTRGLCRVNSDPLWRCVRKLDLEELLLKCECQLQPTEEAREGACIFAEDRSFNESYSMLQVCCPNLKVLEVSACALSRVGGSSWPVTDRLHKLEKAIIVAPSTAEGLSNISRDALPANTYFRLESFWSYELEDALSLGEKLLCFDTSGTLERYHIAMLATCLNLERLDVWIAHGLEEDLVSALSMMKSLRTLDLKWGEIHDDDAEYATLRSGIALQIAQAAQSVSELTLLAVKISLFEWEAILKLRGDGLTTLRVSVTGQDESVLDRWEAMVFFVMKFCPKIRSFLAPDGSEMRSHEGIIAAMNYLKMRSPHASLTGKR